MQLEGTLDTFPLRELIEMVVYSSVTGALQVQVDGGIGRLYFRDGRPYHAVAGEHTGINAVGAMFEQKNARFRFAAGDVSTDTTLWMDPLEMIEHAEELARLWQKVRQVIPDVGQIPYLLGNVAQSQVHINETTWPVLSVIDGQRTVEEISAHLNLVLLDTCLALVTLIEQGLVGVKRSPAAKPPAIVLPATLPKAPEPAPAPAVNSSGFLERLLADAKAKEQQRPDLTDDQAQESKQVYRYVDDRR